MKTIALISLSLFLLLAFCPLAGNAQTTNSGWQWVESMGGTGRDVAEMPAIDSWGNVFVCGKFSDTAWFGSTSVVSMGNRDAYIAKYDANGALLWIRTVGSLGHAEAISVATDHLGNVAITGHYYGTAHFDDTTITLSGDPLVSNGFVAMYSPTGALLWFSNTSGGYTRSNGVAFDPQGNLYITGRYQDTVAFGPHVLQSPGDQNVFLVKYNMYGSILWVADAGGSSRAWASSVSTDSHGNAYITGAIRDTAYFGASMLMSHGGDDIFLARCSPSGIWEWAVNAGGTGDDFGNGIEVDVFGHIAITGSFFGTATFPPLAPITSYGGRDGYVAYFDPTGACLWANPFGGTSTDKGIGVTTDEIGNVYVSGYINGIGNFGFFQKASSGADDISIAKYTRTGMVMWAELAGGSGNEYGKGIRALTQGQLYVTGYFEGTANFGSHAVTSQGDRESYLAKFWDGTPIITSQPPSQNLCVGDTLRLEMVLADTAGISYSWFKDSSVIPGANTPVLTIVCTDTLPTGKYTAIAQTISGYVVSDTAFVNVDNYPVITFNPPGPTVVVSYSGPPMTLDAGAGYNQYLWSTGDTTHSVTYTAVELLSFFQGHNWGYLSVTVSSQYGCTTTDSVQVFVGNSVEGLEDTAPQVLLYPNPVRGNQVVVDSDVPIRRVEVFTPAGELVMVHDKGRSATHQVELPLGQLAKGLYFVRIDAGKTTLVRKLVRE